jgi:arylsulfatase A-like enzyme
VLDLLGLPPLPETDGRSLVPLIEAAARGDEMPDPAGPASPSAISYLDRSWGTWGENERAPDPLVSIRRGPLRLIFRTAAPNTAELYDHASDPREQRNLAPSRPAQAAELRRESEEWLSQSAPWGATPEVEIDEMHVEQLRALGYLRDK